MGMAEQTVTVVAVWLLTLVGPVAGGWVLMGVLASLLGGVTMVMSRAAVVVTGF